ncbi:hypothetical protein C1H76_1673 [Elsinoe australis]|uniref:Uncharacterized protein n=1 Tax=Elsinoe australis TaxID=40998 RepID=A0A4U7BDG0_9PEZI|nr:hypothetical protein C1H76_1673 [Elsinoe australis]
MPKTERGGFSGGEQGAGVSAVEEMGINEVGIRDVDDGVEPCGNEPSRNEPSGGERPKTKLTLIVKGKTAT